MNNDDKLRQALDARKNAYAAVANRGALLASAEQAAEHATVELIRVMKSLGCHELQYQEQVYSLDGEQNELIIEPSKRRFVSVAPE